MVKPQRKDSIDELTFLTVNALEIENTHFMKNPFFRVTILRFPKVKENEDGAFLVRCMSGFKSKLKNKNWQLVQSERPTQIGNSLLTDLSFIYESSSQSTEGFDCDLNSIKSELKTTSRESSFEAEIIFIKTEVECRQKDKAIIDEFKIIRYLPNLTKQEIVRKSVTINSKLAKTTDKVLALELNNTLISYKDINPVENGKLHKRELFTRNVTLRPGAMKLLNELYKTYEIIIYTTLDEDFTNTLIKRKLDKKGVIINTVLAKDYCFKKDGYYIKDLRILKNRDLAKVVLLDSSLISSCKQMDNCIIVPPYSTGKSDKVLFEVVNLLKKIANESDVRQELKRLYMLSDMYKMYLNNTN